MTPHNFPARSLESDYAIADTGDATTLHITKNFGVVRLISAGAETRTLAAPTKVGIVVTLAFVTDGGDITLTVTGGYDESGTTSMVFNTIGDYARFVSVEEGSGTYVWRVSGYDGVTGPVVALGAGAFDSIVGTDSSLGIAGQASTTTTGGAVAIAGGATTNATSAGGAVSLVGGAGNTSGAGGAVNITGGTPGVTGTGGAVVIVGGAGGATSGVGGAIQITGGAGTANNDNGGAVTIAGGAPHGTGVKGTVTATGLITKAGTTAVAITGATALTQADSGGIFTVAQSSAYDVDLPSPTTGPGLNFVFSLTAPGAFNVTITVLGAAATFVGTIVNDVTSVIPATGSTLTFASGNAALGDTIIIRSIATNLYHVQAIASTAAGITIS